MSNPKSNESEDLLYKCDNSYIKQLNVIRRQLNFLEINDEEEREENDNTEEKCQQNFEITNPSTTDSSFNVDLYNCDDQDLKRLNAIRKQLNLVEIESLQSKSVTRNGESVPGVCSFEGQCSSKREDSHHRRKEKRKHKQKRHKPTKKEKVVEVLYSPPAKKMCFRESPVDLQVHEETPTSLQQFLQEEEEVSHNQNIESDNCTTDFSISISSPSEKSSPVKNLMAYTSNIGAISSPVSQKTQSTADDSSNFCSLNVPIYDDKQSASLSVVSEEEPESLKLLSLFENMNLMTTTNSSSSRNILDAPISSLELPKLSRNFYDFPILANIYQWSDIFAKRAVRSVELRPHREEIKRYSRAKSLEAFHPERPPMRIREKVDVDGMSTLSTMSGWRERLGFDFYLNSILWMSNRIAPLQDTQVQQQETEERASSGDDEDERKSRKKNCGCFRQCFGKKRKKFFK